MIEGKQFPLNKVFCDDFVFEIPKYQRPYSWTTEEAGALLQDLLDFIQSQDCPLKEMNEYFLGSIVLIKAPESPKAEVVDGQQRLTTLTILLSVLRQFASQKLQNGLEEFICEEGNPNILGSEDRYRLTLRDKDNEFFRDFVQKSEGLEDLKGLDVEQLKEESKKNIVLNARHFSDQLAKLAQDEIDDLTRFVINKCFLVLVWTPDFQSAFRIFSVLNDRGMDLSVPDILKTEVLEKLPGDKMDVYAKKWEDQEDSMGRDAFKELLAHIRTIHVREKPKKTVLEEIRAFVKPAADPTSFIDDQVLPYAEAFRIIRSCSYRATENAHGVNQLLGWLNRIDNFDWVPPAIVKFATSQDSASVLTFVRDLERLAAGMMILRYNVNDRMKRYGNLIRAMEKGEDLSADTSPLQLTTEEKLQVRATLNGDVYLVGKIRKFVLLRLDTILAGNSGATYDHNFITVEHVLPQSPEDGSQWLTWFGTRQVCDQWVHRIGNLVLLSQRKNSQASNYEFRKKRDLYFKGKGDTANFALTNRVLAENDWTPTIIEKNQNEYLTKLSNLWRLA